MKFIDLFAGIGGFRGGFEEAGHECVGFCEYDKFAVYSYTSMHLMTEEQRESLKNYKLYLRRKELDKYGEKYRNGEWYANDIKSVEAYSMPKADCLCFGAPCQDFSIAGNRKGLNGSRSILVKEVFRIVAGFKERDKPEWLVYENVKGMLSSNKGWDYAFIITEMESLGYDIQWQLLNSKDFGVPQNRERVYTVGHLRDRGRRKIFPIEGNSSEININQIMMMNSDKRNNPSTYRVYGINGVSPTINTCGGGGQEPHIQVTPEMAIPCLTPGRINKRQNGRRFKENGEPMFTLTAQDIHGVAIEGLKPEHSFKNIAIRKLTPKEFFRLQGWEDEYYERARLVNSDNKLYKQAGNGVTKTVAKAIGIKIKECGH